MEPFEVMLKIMEDNVKQIYNDYLFLKKREVVRRNSSDIIRSRLNYLRLLSVLTIIVFTIWQIFNLKSYFIKKKLI